MAKTILNSTFKFSQEEVNLSEMSSLLNKWESENKDNTVLKQYSYCICIIEVIRNIANGELGIPLDDRLKLIELIIEQLKGNIDINFKNVIEVDFINKR